MSVHVIRMCVYRKRMFKFFTVGVTFGTELTKGTIGIMGTMVITIIIGSIGMMIVIIIIKGQVATTRFLKCTALNDAVLGVHREKKSPLS